MLAFGPVPSRRLGRSIGINNIPPKVCTYACVYCQLGRTPRMEITRQAFYSSDDVVESAKQKISLTREAGERIDYLTFVPDGEPTLDINLGHEIRRLKPFEIPIAVISNSSLIWDDAVRDALASADWVSLKMDAVREETWRKVDRPHGKLSLEAILDGALAFREYFHGTLVTETMLVRGINDGESDVQAVAEYLTRLRPDIAYLSVPTRPPAEAWVYPPSENSLNRAFQNFSAALPKVEYLIGYEGNTFTPTGDAEQDLLSILAVHPMREDAVQAFLDECQADWNVVQRLLEAGKLIETVYRGERFYLRELRRPQPRQQTE